MAKMVGGTYRKKVNKKRPSTHSKNASKGQNGYKSKYKGQGRQMGKDFTISIGNIIWVIGVIFMAGTVFANISQLGKDIIVLEQRLEKKIKIINECEDRLIELEKELARTNCIHK